MTTATTLPLRVAIVDDEPLARQGLSVRLQAIGAIDVVSSHGDARAAALALKHDIPDVLFLDIQMPEIDGFQLLERIGRGALPAVVFVTAFSEHAVRAFRVGAMDYLVKPYDDETLRAAVTRVRDYVDSVRRAPAGEQAQGAEETRLFVKDGRGFVVLQPSEIEWVESAGDSIRVHAHGTIYSTRTTLSGFAARLDPARFIRVHRTTIVAIDQIRGLEPYSRGEHVVVLRDGTRLPLSRRARDQVLTALQIP